MVAYRRLLRTMIPLPSSVSAPSDCPTASDCPTEEAFGRLLPSTSKLQCAVAKAAPCFSIGALYSWVLLFLLALGVLLCSGCGRRDTRYAGRWGGMSKEQWLAQYRQKQEEEQRQQEQQKQKAAQQKAAQQQKQQRQPESVPTPPAKGSDEAGKTAPSQYRGGSGVAMMQSGRDAQPASDDADTDPDELPKLQQHGRQVAFPASFDQWTEEHFTQARQHNVTQLPDAVRHLAETNKGNAEVVPLLVDLVRTPEGREAGSTLVQRARGSSAARLIGAVVEALAQNGTEAADQALRDLLTGKIPTDDDRLAAKCVLQALAERGSAESTALVVEAAVLPEQFRPAQQAPLTADLLQREAFATIAACADPALLEKLSQRIDDTALASETVGKIEQLVEVTNPEHLRATLVLAGATRTSQVKRAAVFRQLATWSGSAVDVLQNGEANYSQAEIERLRLVAKAVWSEQFAGVLGRYVTPYVATDPGCEAAAIRLAITIPQQWARALVYRWLMRRWVDGPSPLGQTAGTPVCEPGLLAAAGLLLQEQISPLVPVDTPAKKSATAARPTPGGLQPVERARAQALGGTARQWAEFVDGLGAATSSRLATAAFAVSGSTSPGADQSQELLEQFSIPIPDGQAVRLVWSVDLAIQAEKLGWPVAVDRTAIHFARLELTDRPMSLVSRYRRVLPGADERTTTDGVLLEKLARDQAENGLQLWQVRITKAVPEIPRSADEEQPLVVELLSVAVADPAAESGQAVASVKKAEN